MKTQKFNYHMGGYDMTATQIIRRFGKAVVNEMRREAKTSPIHTGMAVIDTERGSVNLWVEWC